uniref:Uncharacterized protein n=1 Tax=Zea mays TaxID=4577 RepID=A0A804QDS7_MAIZE
MGQPAAGGGTQTQARGDSFGWTSASRGLFEIPGRGGRRQRLDSERDALSIPTATGCPAPLRAVPGTGRVRVRPSVAALYCGRDVCRGAIRAARSCSAPRFTPAIAVWLPQIPEDQNSVVCSFRMERSISLSLTVSAPKQSSVRPSVLLFYTSFFFFLFLFFLCP